MLTLAELLPEKTLRRLELLKQPTPKKQSEDRVKKPEKTKKTTTKESLTTKKNVVEILAHDPLFNRAVWKGQEKKVRRIVKDTLRKQELQVRRNFWWVYLEATRVAAMLPVNESAGKKAAVAR